MNLSRTISHIMMQLGLRYITLPFEEPTDTVIRDVLTMATIPMYSQFSPWIKETTVNLAYERVVDKKQNIYILPDELTTTPVMSVIDVHLPISVNRGMYGDVATPFGVSRSLQGVLAHQAYSMVIGALMSFTTS